MTLDRRRFLKTTLAGSAALAIGGCNSIASAESKARGARGNDVELKISFQEGTAPGANLNEKFDFMEEHGVVGFEPHGQPLLHRKQEMIDALKGRNIKVSAVCAGFEGFILSTDPEVRKRCRDSMAELIIAGGEVGSTGVIIVPAFNHQQPVMPHTQETRDFLCEQFDEMGTLAQQHGTTVILEPLNRREAFYLRQLPDAATICRDINNPGVTCLGDFWHMTWEETSDYAAFISANEYLQHVHIASRATRNNPGEDGEVDNYVDGFRALKEIGYDKYVSFESGSIGDREVVVPEALELMRKQWGEA